MPGIVQRTASSAALRDDGFHKGKCKAMHWIIFQMPLPLAAPTRLHNYFRTTCINTVAHSKFHFSIYSFIPKKFSLIYKLRINCISFYDTLIDRLKKTQRPMQCITIPFQTIEHKYHFMYTIKLWASTTFETYCKGNIPLNNCLKPYHTPPQNLLSKNFVIFLFNVNNRTKIHNLTADTSLFVHCEARSQYCQSLENKQIPMYDSHMKLRASTNKIINSYVL